MEYRNEWKYLVTGGDLAILRARLNVVLRPDAHQTGAVYCIRSLYFDDARDSALREHEDGVDARRSATKSLIATSGSCPTADITGISES